MVCVCKSDSVWEFCQASAWAIQGVGTAPGKRGQTERKQAPSGWLTKFQHYLGLCSRELPLYFDSCVPSAFYGVLLPRKGGEQGLSCALR